MNRKYGLKLHSAGRIRCKDREKFEIVLLGLCHYIHHQAEVHPDPDLAGLMPFRPLLKHIRHPSRGTTRIRKRRPLMRCIFAKSGQAEGPTGPSAVPASHAIIHDTTCFSCAYCILMR